MAKVVLVLALLVCALMLVSSCVAAAEVPVAASNAKEQNNTGEFDAVDENKQVLCRRPRRCCGFSRVGCIRCCSRPTEAAAVPVDDNKQSLFCGRPGCCRWVPGTSRCAYCCRPPP